jgi:hypothetical protein
MEWKDISTWDEMAQEVAKLKSDNEWLRERVTFLENRIDFHKSRLQLLMKDVAHSSGDLKPLLGEYNYPNVSALSDITTADNNTSVGHSMTETVNTGEHVRDSLTTTDEQDKEAIESESDSYYNQINKRMKGS